MSKTSPNARAWAVTLLMAAGAVLPSADAGIVITTLAPGSEGVLQTIRTGALDLHWSALTAGNGVAAQARFVETRTSQLINPVSGGLQYQDLVADSGWITTQQRGAGVIAFASIDLTPVDPNTFVAPAAAKVSAFGNHARAFTGQRLEMENDVDVTVQGTVYPAYSIFKTSGNTASARTAWYDTWQANQSGSVSLSLALDGSLSEDAPCLVQSCGLIIPPGITSIQTRSPRVDFWASFTVLDMDTLVDCDDPDRCGIPGARPKAVGQLVARYVQEDEDSLPILHDTTHVLSFETIAGHRYVAIGLMDVESSNGGRVGFENSLRMTGVNAPVGALSSSALGGDLASAFLSPVPEPGSWWMLAAGLVFLAHRRCARQA
jgi:hypothetical protein